MKSVLIVAICLFVHCLAPAQEAVVPASAEAKSPAMATDEQIGAMCEPDWADEAQLQIDGELAVLLTHFTDRLDTSYATQPGMHRLTSISKANEWPLIYLHERHAKAEQYFYSDCHPTAYVDSSLGHFEFNSESLRHIIVAGGYYELCLNNTFTQILQNWSNLRGSQELRITLAMDAVYGVASDSLTTDPFNAELRKWIGTQPSGTLLMSSVLEQLGNRDDVWTFLSRRWQEIPYGFGLHVRYKDEITAVRFAAKDFPTFVIHYTTSDELARFVDVESKQPLPIEAAAAN